MLIAGATIFAIGVLFGWALSTAAISKKES